MGWLLLFVIRIAPPSSRRSHQRSRVLTSDDVAELPLRHPFSPWLRGPPRFSALSSFAEEQMRRFRSTVASLTSLALAFQAPLAAQAADSGASDLAAQVCDRFAAPRLDTDYSGPREPISRVNRDQALEACRQAASAQPARGRYAYLYGRALWNGFQRYDEAAKQFAAAREAGNPWGALGLGRSLESRPAPFPCRGVAGRTESRSGAMQAAHPSKARCVWRQARRSGTTRR